MLPSLEVPKTNNATPISEGSVVNLDNVEAEKIVVPKESKVKLNELGGKSEGSKTTETAPASDNTAKPVENKEDTTKSDNGPARVINAFSYYDNMYRTSPPESQYFDLENNISAAVNYIPRLIVMNQDNAVDLEIYSHECSESITKPPVFETHISGIDHNSSILSSLFKFRPGHAFLSIRYTYAKMLKGRPVSFSRRRLTLGFNGKLEIGAPSLITDDRIEDAQISTQTPITVGQTVKLFESMQSYFSTYTKYGLILRNCNKFVKTMAEEIGLHNLASAHDKVMPISTAKILSKNIVKDEPTDLDKSTAFLDYNIGETSTFIPYNRLLDISDDYKESDKITNNRFERSEKGKTERSEMINKIMKSKRYKYSFWKDSAIIAQSFKENAERAARKDLSLIDKMMSRKYKVNKLERQIEDISDVLKLKSIKLVHGGDRECEFESYDTGAFFKAFFMNDNLKIINMLKKSIETAGEKHGYLNSYLLSVINAIIMQYNMHCESEGIPIQNVKNVFDIDDFSGGVADYDKMRRKK